MLRSVMHARVRRCGICYLVPPARPETGCELCPDGFIRSVGWRIERRRWFRWQTLAEGEAGSEEEAARAASARLAAMRGGLSLARPATGGLSLATAASRPGGNDR